jgi:hypothetical protein
METFTAARAFVENPRFDEQRRAALAKLDFAILDRPIAGVVESIARLSYCFTLQSCFGHFLYMGQQDIHNVAPLPADADIGDVEYRIAYLALCIEDSVAGRALFAELRDVAAADPEYIQFGSADWFWERQPNSYAIQVEPRRHMLRDRCTINHQEALRVEEARNHFFDEIAALLQNL